MASETMLSGKNVLFVASEYDGLVKTGGLADVAKALPAALRQAGVNVKVLIPCYRDILAKSPPKVIDSLPVPLNLNRTYGCSVRKLEDQGVEVWLLEHNEFFDRPGLYDHQNWPYEDNPERFGLLSKASFELCRALNFVPDIIHAHDWQTGMVPYYLKVHYQDDPFFAATRVVYNIHNGAYQGHCHAMWLSTLGIDPVDFCAERFEDHGNINLLKGGVVYADAVVPVSPGYAEELKQESSSHGLWHTFNRAGNKVQGILNGCDYGQWDPATDEAIPANYHADDLSGKDYCKRAMQAAVGLEPGDSVPLFGIVSRLTDQKGFHYLVPALHEFLQHPVQLVILGSGDPHFAGQLHHLAETHPGQVQFTEGYSESLSHRIEAASDFFIMPSLFEPCGLNQIYSMKYGTLPIVRRTGGLRDTVIPLTADQGNVDRATGIGFESASMESTLDALLQALALYRDTPAAYQQVQQNAMAASFTWDGPAQEYIALYARVHRQ